MRVSILVVEDNADVCQVLVEGLSEQTGFVVSAAGSIGKARALLAGGHFDVLVLDVGLPDGNGRDFCAALRRQGVGTPVILMSGLAHEEDVVLGFEAGADDYLAKPFRTAELVARIGCQMRHAPEPTTPHDVAA